MEHIVDNQFWLKVIFRRHERHEFNTQLWPISCLSFPPYLLSFASWRLYIAKAI